MTNGFKSFIPKQVLFHYFIRGPKFILFCQEQNIWIDIFSIAKLDVMLTALWILNPLLGFLIFWFRKSSREWPYWVWNSITGERIVNLSLSFFPHYKWLSQTYICLRYQNGLNWYSWGFITSFLSQFSPLSLLSLAWDIQIIYLLRFSLFPRQGRHTVLAMDRHKAFNSWFSNIKLFPK